MLELRNIIFELCVNIEIKGICLLFMYSVKYGSTTTGILPSNVYTGGGGDHEIFKVMGYERRVQRTSESGVVPDGDNYLS